MFNLLYFFNVGVAYIFCIVYVCIKSRDYTGADTVITGGGLPNFMKLGEGGKEMINPTVQRVFTGGILLLIINVFTNVFLYLKNKEENKDDNMARSIYHSQIAVLWLLLLTIIYYATYRVSGRNNDIVAWHDFNSDSSSGIIMNILVFVGLIIGGIVLMAVKIEGGGFLGLGKNKEDK